MEFIEIVAILSVGFIMGMVLGANMGANPNKLANSPELRQCLSQSGTTWQGGECIIILNK